MDKVKFESDMRGDGFRVVNTSIRPNLMAPNHCHDFDARALVLGGEISIIRDNNLVTFREGQCFEVPPAACMPSMSVRKGLPCCRAAAARGPLTREAFESDLRREGFEVVNGGQKADFAEDMHAHDFDARIMVLGGEITIGREGKTETLQGGRLLRDPGGLPAHRPGRAGRRRLYRRESLSPPSGELRHEKHMLMGWGRVDISSLPQDVLKPHNCIGRSVRYGKP